MTKHKVFGAIVFLHGIEERGNNVSILKREGLPKLLEENEININFIVLSPQLPSDMYWSSDIGIQIIEKMLEILKSNQYDDIVENKDKLYLTGLSMGGFGVLYYASLYPNKFAAYAPICGGLNPMYKHLIRPLTKIPLWLFHGEQDKIADISHSDKLVKHISKYKRIKKHKYSLLKYTRYQKCLNYESNKAMQIFEDNQHDSWTQTYLNQQLYHWFNKYSIQHYQIIDIIISNIKKFRIAEIILIHLFQWQTLIDFDQFQFLSNS